MRQSWYAIVGVVLLGMALLITLLATPADACAVCAGSEDQGYFWGVLFLMATPFLIGSSIGGWLLYSYRRAQPGSAPCRLDISGRGWAPRGSSGASHVDLGRNHR
jgi:hypothetical protein